MGFQIGNSRCGWKLMARGVAQGSMAGLVIFSIFINDLFYFMETVIMLCWCQ